MGYGTSGAMTPKETVYGQDGQQEEGALVGRGGGGGNQNLFSCNKWGPKLAHLQGN